MKFTKKMNIACIVSQVLIAVTYFVLCWRALSIPSDMALSIFMAAFSIEQICTTYIKTSENKYGVKTEAPSVEVPRFEEER